MNRTVRSNPGTSVGLLFPPERVINSIRESALKWRREERDMKHMNIETLIDILDWFDDGLYDYLNHILLTKLDGEARIRRAMPELRKYARSLVAAYRGTDRAYPEGLLNLPA